MTVDPTDVHGNVAQFNTAYIGTAIIDELVTSIEPPSDPAHIVIAIPVLQHSPTDADFTNPVDGIICVVSNRGREPMPDQLFVRINGVWKSTNLT